MDWAHLAIGAEILWGDTLNTHSQSLALWLRKLGYRFRFQVTCDDVESQIIEVLHFLRQHPWNIIVTGGLGPTADDVTRQAVAKAWEKSLVFHPEAWAHVVGHLEKRGVTVRESHRQEALVPEGSVIFPNPVGTACGFGWQPDHRWVLVLPGPKRELEAMWPHVEAFIRLHCGDGQWEFHSVWVVNAVESQVDALVKEYLKVERRDWPLEWGLKLDIPYVEVRFWYPRSQVPSSEWNHFWQGLIRQLSPFGIILDKPQLAQRACQKALIEPQNTLILVNPPSEYLIQRLRPLGFRFCEGVDWMPNQGQSVWVWRLNPLTREVLVTLPNQQVLRTQSPLNANFSWHRHERYLVEWVLWQLSGEAIK